VENPSVKDEPPFDKGCKQLLAEELRIKRNASLRVAAKRLAATRSGALKAMQ
jgi:hypothetical protein